MEALGSIFVGHCCQRLRSPRCSNGVRPPAEGHDGREVLPRSVVELATEVERLPLVLATTVGDRYRVKVSEGGSMVGLWRR